MDNTSGLLSEEEINKYRENDSYHSKTLIMIPCYNEEESIQNAIEIGSKVGKVLVVNDGSSDNSLEVATQYSDYVISNRKNLGLAKTIANAVNYGTSLDFEYFIIFDADCQYTLTDLITVSEIIKKSKYDIVMGSRLQGFIHEMPWSKKMGNWIFSKALTYITRIPISDGQTGLRAFTKTFAESIQLRGNFTYTQEMLFETAQNNFEMVEVPITFEKREFGESRLMNSPFDYAARAWALNIQIIAEYNPLKFSVSILGGLMLFSFIALFEKYNNISVNSSILIIILFVLILEIGLYASIILRYHKQSHKGIRYNIIKEEKESTE
jgi:glycosyltransferase involved in cell wall biosynthesis